MKSHRCVFALCRLSGLAAALSFAHPLHASGQPPLTAATTIEIKDSKGKFDFLTVDTFNRRLLAAHEKDETADFIDLGSSQVLARLKTGPAVGITPDASGTHYYVSVQDDKRIAVVDAINLKETSSIALPGETDAILFDAKDGCLYVTHDNGDELWAVDVASAKIKATIPMPNGPECMAHDASTDRIYLNSKTTSQVAVISTKTNKVEMLWPTAPATGPHGLAFDAETGRIYVAGENGILVAIDARTGKVVGHAPITTKVDQIAMDAETKRIFCAGPGKMSVVQATKDGVESLGDVPSAETAKNVAVDPATHLVWTTYTDGTNSYAKSWAQP